MSELYIGLMSGTSMDGIDAALVRFGDSSVDILATHELPYPEDLRSDLLGARSNDQLRHPDDVPELHARVGRCFGDAADELLAIAGKSPAMVTAIGSHGQTLRHAPNEPTPFSLQIGDPSLIALHTGIRTVADFRGADIEAGGQGAPLAPAFHEWLFRQPGETQVVLNIGGIANITILHADDRATSGFDTGPGNTLLDAWAAKCIGSPFDRDGEWAASGKVVDSLLTHLLEDPYFSLPAPKSTGFEYFNLGWLAPADIDRFDPADVQATLCELTAGSIAASIRKTAPDARRVLVCGGGIHNDDLMSRIARSLPGIAIRSTATAGLDPDWVEAVAFAWLAMRNLGGLPGNLPSVTGARRPVVLGIAYPPT